MKKYEGKRRITAWLGYIYWLHGCAALIMCILAAILHLTIGEEKSSKDY